MTDPINETNEFKKNIDSNFLNLVHHGDTCLIEQYLKQHPSSLHATDEEGNTALHVAVASLRKLPIFKRLVQYGVQPDAVNNQKWTALQHAIDRPQTSLDVSQYLVSIAPHLMNQIGVRFGDDDTCIFHYAILKGRHELTQFMLDQGASITFKSRFHFTVLHFAAAMDNVKTLEACIQRGADIHALTTFGQSAYDVAHRNNAQAATDYLKQVQLASTEQEQLGEILLSKPDGRDPREPSASTPRKGAL